MPDDRAPYEAERDRPRPQEKIDRPVHGDKLNDAASPTPSGKAPKRTGDMDQPGMDPDDSDTA